MHSSSLDVLLEVHFLSQIYQESVDRSNVNVGMADIKTCELAVDWKGQLGTDLPVLRRRINLVGAKNPKNFTLRICPPTAAGRYPFNAYICLHVYDIIVLSFYC